MGFDGIADSWYGKRHHSIFPDELGELKERWKAGSVLNIGCGHGADFVPLKGMELLGLDNSKEMLSNAMKYSEKFQFKVSLACGDAVHLPFKDSSFDFAIGIAVYHHLRGLREEGFRELYRVLKGGGEAFITVWNKTQPRFIFSGKEAIVPWGKERRERYYYLYSYGELERSLRSAGFEVLKMFPEKRYTLPIKHFSRNICALVSKPSSEKQQMCHSPV